MVCQSPAPKYFYQTYMDVFIMGKCRFDCLPLPTPYGIDECPLPSLGSLPWVRCHFSYTQNRTGQSRVPIVSTSKCIVRVSCISGMSNPQPETNSEQKATINSILWGLAIATLKQLHTGCLWNKRAGNSMTGAIEEQCAEGFAE